MTEVQRGKKAEYSLRLAGQIRKNKGELSKDEKNKLKEAEKIEKVIDFMDDTEIEPLVSAAMTYWVTQCSYNGATEPEDISYGLAIKDNKGEIPTRAEEKREIERIIKHAKKLIPLIHDRMIKLKIIVERKDYKDLIKKYNGKVVSSDPEEAELYEQITKYPKLWYFDPPYHSATLSGGNKAPYEDSFGIGEVHEMVEILHGDHEEDYGKIEYFIKSDYDPKYTYEQFKEQLEEAKQKLAYEVKKSGKSEKIKKYKEFIARMTKQVGESGKYLQDFDILEENIERDKHKANTKKPVFYKECLGDFDKGATDSERGEKLKGREYIWCRGNYVPED